MSYVSKLREARDAIKSCIGASQADDNVTIEEWRHWVDIQHKLDRAIIRARAQEVLKGESE